MNTAEPGMPPPPRVICLSPTKMAGDWPAEVAKKLADQGVDRQSAMRIADAARLAMQPSDPPRRVSLWRRIQRLFGCSD
jgi:hypothetical protein